MQTVTLDAQARRRNLRTALVLASVAVALFVGMLVRYAVFS